MKTVVKNLFVVPLIVAAMLCYTIAFEASAQTVQVSLPNVTAEPGDVITAPVIINESSGVTGATIRIELPNFSDDFPLEVINVLNNGTLTSDWFVQIADNTTSSGILNIAGAGNFSLLPGSGVLYNINLRVKDNAFGQTVDLNFNENSTLNDGNLPAEFIDGQVTIDAPPPVPTDTPTLSPTPTLTPTPSLTPTPTPTFDPFQTPATATPRADNQPPVIVVEPSDRFTVLQGQELDILVIASDADGDELDVFLSLNARATLKSSEQLPTSKLVEFSLDTSILGDSSFTVFANDGERVASKDVFVSVVSSLTPVPSITPTPPEVFVTDDPLSFDDLTGQTDFDDSNNRQLTVRWNVSTLDGTDWHVYVQTGFGSRQFLGSTGGGDIKLLNWTPNSPLINSAFTDGPQFGNSYTFTIIRIDGNVTPDDFFQTRAPVGYNNTGGGPVALPSRSIAVTDDNTTTADLSGQTDFDSPEDKQLTIRWIASPQNATDWHIFVRRGFGERKFLGRTGTGFADHFSWFPDAPLLTPEFNDGPLFNSIYLFEVIRIDNRLNDEDEIIQTVPVGFNFIGGEPLPVEENPVKVFDHFEAQRDLTGLTDFDTPGERLLTIQWAQPVGDALDWHIYVREGLAGRKFLGRTGNGTVQFFDWFPDSPNTSAEFAAGPQFNQFYNFRVIRIDSNPSADDVFDQPFPVGFNQTGSSNVKLTQLLEPNLKGRRIAIFDDIIVGDDLAPIGNIGSDSDPPDRRFIHIAWNFNADQSVIFDHHIEVSVNGGPFRFLGQTQDNNQQYFWWSPDELFKTASQFSNGPQDGNDYQFRVSRRNPSSQSDFLVSGTLTYNVRSDVITPTSTPELPLPTFTPTKTATPTLTQTPTRTPTPTPTPLDLPFTFKSLDPAGERLELVLPGVVNDIKPLQLQLIRLGRFDLGSPETERGRMSNETLIEDVFLTQNYYLGSYEVTQAQWQAVMGNNPSWFDDSSVSFNHPVESVSWIEVQEFIDVLNQQVNQGFFRLPTEAEWEYACRGLTQTRFSHGNVLDCTDFGDEFCQTHDRFMWWIGNNSVGDNPYGTKPVGLKEPNPFGLFDMHGNVLEWCEDWFAPYDPNDRIDPAGPVTGLRKVARGGSWALDAAFCRSAKRFSQLPDNRFVTVGFRIAWQVERPEEESQ